METGSKIIDHHVLLQIQHQHPQYTQHELYEAAKNYVRSQYPTALQYEQAIKFITETLDI